MVEKHTFDLSALRAYEAAQPKLSVPHTLLKHGGPPHPGNLLREKMDKLAISPYRLSKLIGVQRSRLERIVAEKGPVTADTALRLARFFGGPAEQWLELQIRYDLAALRPKMEAVLAGIHSIKAD